MRRVRGQVFWGMVLAGILSVTQYLHAADEAPSKDMTAHQGHGAPHSFLLPRGIPDAVGSYNIQLNPFVDQKDGVTTLDVGGHLSYGLFDWGGIHLRSLGAKTATNFEVIGMASLYRDSERRNGISLLAIAAIPTNKRPGGDEHNHGLGYLLGVASHLELTRAVFLDSTLHYDFTAKHFIPEAGVIADVGNSWFLTLDTRASIGSDSEVSLLPGFKHEAFENTYIGVGYRQPLLADSPFDRQIYFQLEIGRH